MTIRLALAKVAIVTGKALVIGVAGVLAFVLLVVIVGFVIPQYLANPHM